MRLLIALIPGIVTERYCCFPLWVLAIGNGICGLIILSYAFISLKNKFRFRSLYGIFLCLTISITGAMVVHFHNIKNRTSWFGHNIRGGTYINVTLLEPLIEKHNTYKALAKVNGIYKNSSLLPATGLVLLYFKKGSNVAGLNYGTKVLVKNYLQPIRNNGNPGGFDYQNYCFYQGITHQAFLRQKDYLLLPGKDMNALAVIIFTIRKTIVGVLHQNVKSPKENGMAEALLIGYKDDLDKTLVQSYTNAGVVHIIAISGMHLALIYGLLMSITAALKMKRLLNWIRVALVITGIWLFSILSGAQPSILRSAIMFSSIAFAELASRRTSTINTLCLSAFILLCYNPYWLWDPGFQLSYIAVLSIIIFFKPVCSLCYFNNKLLQLIWNSIAVCLAAQILTFPICLYHFHQMPLLFILTNLVAVPLSSVILFTEIILCIGGAFPFIGNLAGMATSYMIRFMNQYIERFASLPFASWNFISISVAQAILLGIITASFSYWWRCKNSRGLLSGLTGLLLFISIRSVSFINACNQQTLIIYNIPKYSAVELISGTSSKFMGNKSLSSDQELYKQYIVPSHTALRIKEEISPPVFGREIYFNNKHIVLLDSSISFTNLQSKNVIDYLILSGNAKINKHNTIGLLRARQIVLDSSVPYKSSLRWKKLCDSLHKSCFDVRQNGAFLINFHTPTFALFSGRSPNF